MNLEIIIKDGLIHISAGWLWYAFICMWLVLFVIDHGLNIRLYFLNKKIKNMLVTTEELNSDIDEIILKSEKMKSEKVISS
jgi:hypothetical protein